ncbi:MAG: Holliday junction resolvase RuvX [Kiritimatiellae bacterium]|nr:Holliday junction resolvase RuvX [Kiritimatiellia bacterium]
MGRVLGLDYGEKRIGVALSDPTRFLASPHTMIERGDEAEVIRRITEICTQQQVDLIVLGLPLNMNGTRGPAVEKALAFKERLHAALPEMPIKTWDERLSTVSAQRVLIDAGESRKKRKGLVDKIAAQFILQNWLDAQ